MTKPTKSLSYDEALKRLETIVSQLEEQDQGMDELTQLVREASTLVKTCKMKLKMTEEEIKNSFIEEDGSLD
ncbi:Exodeoxyribonuclease VII small subunit [Cyclobacterium xiamenense]|uniref:Exodeoxyribonuclease VII small subunit n=1 Tax=Cyclobacterium xiamenense TaxID=1297121 RepID=A0A1H6UG50_9BACT|nr:exodeoxyribonuclease VII small subunit [Cyclobacterium xiamenense]SEI91383.1 Exodeoxyribonuclease VII small subunit [Cyclobacterium xiamenense]